MKTEPTPCTPLELEAIRAISPARVTYPVGSFHKRFARNMQFHTELTKAQRSCVWTTLYRYRRQVADKRLMKMAEEIMKTDDLCHVVKPMEIK